MKYLINTEWQLDRLIRHKDGSTAMHFKALGSRELLTVAIGPDGKVHLLRRGQHMSMKPERRARVERVAHWFNAHEALGGSTKDLPAVKLL